MKITKLEHSGIMVEKDGKKIVCDPVEFTQKLPEMENVVAIVITHKHGDHLQPEKLLEILEKNPQARVFTAQDVEIEGVGAGEIERVEPDVEWDLDGFDLKFFGENHAEIVPGKVPCQNIGVVIDDKVINPGDSFDMPPISEQVMVLLVPSAAPWMKVHEGMEYIKAVKPEKVIPVHNAVSSELGNGFNNNWLKAACEEAGAELVALGVGESIEV